ncbi:AI-2E family transporter [Cellvibrio japonicus]|uniref:Putative membrane protein n=1 Tax=Cellvibrio japonicus (strain Ueda107) TaxID=498211 RepID=B3PBT8_CELJU|nr:AI-2E family transporter [Cellvibrio japonicus]ACE84403.1 putative membrane protein [Cellvibrio japonicus Ueda107]QEI11755.1 AI-2E family transporter [Cellvibrio japonicus]QEI15329.1 AI-2E family transporter [Cellvibrio japonicus]QEI18909.1 AI-2E family transporter [Cellvibrio japonicus]
MNKKLETRTFLLFLLAVSIAFILVLRPFFGTIFWACAITIIFYPLHLRLVELTRGRTNTSALLTLVACILIVVLPAIFLISSVVREGAVFYGKLQSGEINPAQYIEQLRTAFPAVQQALEHLEIDIDNLKKNALDLGMSSGKLIAQHLLNAGQNTFILLLNICLMLYLTFFLLRDGPQLLELLIRALPLGDARERLLFAKFGEVTRATIKGNLVIAVIQGSLGGLIFWVLGIPGALLWGVVMAILSLIPAVGPALIWLPVAIYLFATGDFTKGAILVAFGGGVIGLIDNILRPILVGRDTKLPDYIVLLSTLGGLGLFGVNGFIIGPLVAALFMAFWGIFIREIHILAPDGDEGIAQAHAQTEPVDIPGEPLAHAPDNRDQPPENRT